MKKLTYLLFAAAILVISCTAKEAKVNEETEAEKKASIERQQQISDSIGLANADYLEGNPAPR